MEKYLFRHYILKLFESYEKGALLRILINVFSQLHFGSLRSVSSYSLGEISPKGNETCVWEKTKWKNLFRGNPTYAIKYLANQLRMLGLLLWAYACMPFAWLAPLSSFILNIECCCEQGRGGKGGITLSLVNSPPSIFPPVGKSGKMKTGC